MNKKDIENALALIERRKLSIEKRKSLLNFEMAFFFPLFAFLFVLTFFSKIPSLRIAFFCLSIALIVLDLVYSVFIYLEINKKQKELEEFIDKKILSEKAK